MSQVEKVQAVFDEWAQNGRAEGMEKGHGPTAQQAFSRLALRDQQRYLDIGCGNGYTLRWALEQAPGAEVWGIDVSSKMIDLATRMTLGHQGDKHFISGSFPNPELPKEHFDAIFSMEVFYYLPSVGEGLAATAGTEVQLLDGSEHPLPRRRAHLLPAVHDARDRADADSGSGRHVPDGHHETRTDAVGTSSRCTRPSCDAGHKWVKRG